MPRKKAPDFIEQYMKEAAGHRGDKEVTQRTRSGDKEVTSYTSFKDSDLEQLSFRMSPEDKEQLRRHFDGLGLTLSAGIRMVIKQYMKDSL